MSIQERISHVNYRIPLLFCIGILFFFLYRSTQYPIHDFANSYFPAKFIYQGEFDITIFDPYSFNKKIADTGTSGVFASFNPNPPSVAVLFLPFSFLDALSAKMAFNIISIFLFLFSVYRVCKYLGVSLSWAFILLPIIFFIPLRNNILFGQTYLLLFSLLTEGFLAYEKGNKWMSSLWWALAVYLKVFPVIIFLLLVIRRQNKHAGIFLGVCTMLLFLFIGLQGVDVWKYYFLEVLPRSSSGDLHAAFTSATQSANMLFKYMFVSDEVFNPKPFINSPITFLVSTAVFSSLILALCVDVIKKTQSNWLAFTLLIFCAALLSPQSSSYSMVLIACPLLACCLAVSQKKYWLLLILTLIMVNIPITISQSLPVFLQFQRLFLLLIFFLAIMRIYEARVNLLWFAISMLLLILPSVTSYAKQSDPSVRLVDTEINPLFIDYGEKQSLYYTYWTNYGEKTSFTPILVDSLLTTSVQVRNNQIFFNNTQLTDSKDNKKKPMMINSKEIIYLSDKGKGIGFYAIRKITLP